MKILYIDPILGVSGDMILAAMIDLGVPSDFLKSRLRFITSFALNVSRVKKQGVSACHVQFKIHKKVTPDRFIPLLEKSKLAGDIKAKAIIITEKIFEVEKKIHQTKHLHLHELADADTLLDIVGALVAVDYLEAREIYCKSVKAGQGFIKTAEGNMPAFNFATARLLRGFPVEFLPINAELTTPTGAAIISTIAKPVESFVLSNITGVGLGAGTKDIKGYPNLLRIFMGEAAEATSGECLVIETNIDDMNPQDYELLFEKLYEVGALEVFLTPIIMKKSRPGILLTVICATGENKIFDVIFEHTTTLGLRIKPTKRLTLARQIISLPSPYGKIRVKVHEYNGARRYALEYQDLKDIAVIHNLPMRTVRAKIANLMQKYFKKVLS